QEQAFRPVPQRVNFLVEQAEKPVPKMLIENGARCQLEPTFGPSSVTVIIFVFHESEPLAVQMFQTFIGRTTSSSITCQQVTTVDFLSKIKISRQTKKLVRLLNR
ncbi:hypothetical protein, partial [Microcoleus sp. Z1_B5]|uniref:hypothetical protein n=1 Tax=Microcoleus sp. Z1_B5 TaxID=3055430 RepID=UPI002FCFBE7F